MDFDDSPEEAAFRIEANEFLSAHATLKAPSTNEDASSALADNYWSRPPSREDEARHMAECRAWQRVKYDAGWAGLAWPKEFGGRGLSTLLAGVFAQEEARYDVPFGGFAQSIGMAGPTIITHGSDAQKERYLTPMLTGDETWCQLFSEPEAGSDLAGLRTTAVRDGDEFVVNGQKVWTSDAHHAAQGMLLVRTDPDVAKHRGITYLILDMNSPGIEVRPLVQITGAAHFNEVFLTDVRVPVENTLDDINRGWGPILTTLMNERTAIGGGMGRSGIGDVLTLARTFGVESDPLVRQELAKLYISDATIRFLAYRSRTAASQGRPPGPESSVLKLAATQRLEHQANVVMHIMGAAGTLNGEDAPVNGYWQNYAFLGQWMSRIGGGTEQIQRNIIGDNVLGLPAEPRLDKGIPFRDIGK